LTAAQGFFRMPAEWETHEATWITWPHKQSDWPGKFTPIPWVYAEIVRKLAPGELVRILVAGKKQEDEAKKTLKRAGVDPKGVEYFRFPTDRGWNRDMGPIFVRSDARRGDLQVARFRFSAWAKYPDWKKDDQVSDRVAKALKLTTRPVVHHDRKVVLEGGAIDVNGKGTVLTTEECLLDPVTQIRNPGFTRRDYETVLRDALGVTNVLWLGRGIAGDDTHGHVDDVCRFVSPRTVVLCREKNAGDVNHRPLEENWERLRGMHLEDGSRIDVVNLPMPAPLFLDGQRLPASYANFYVGNNAVLVPTFNDPADRQALGILAELFPGRLVTGIHAVDLVWGLGTIHCLTQQQPARR
jgi:agmatine deiminase